MTTTLDFDSQYGDAQDEARRLVRHLTVALDRHDDHADNDRNLIGMINYGNVADLNAAVKLLERALTRIEVAS